MRKLLIPFIATLALLGCVIKQASKSPVFFAPNTANVSKWIVENNCNVDEAKADIYKNSIS